MSLDVVIGFHKKSSKGIGFKMAEMSGSADSAACLCRRRVYADELLAWIYFAMAFLQPSSFIEHVHVTSVFGVESLNAAWCATSPITIFCYDKQ